MGASKPPLKGTPVSSSQTFPPMKLLDCEILSFIVVLQHAKPLPIHSLRGSGAGAFVFVLCEEQKVDGGGVVPPLPPCRRWYSPCRTVGFRRGWRRECLGSRRCCSDRRRSCRRRCRERRLVHLPARLSSQWSDSLPRNPLRSRLQCIYPKTNKRK